MDVRCRDPVDAAAQKSPKVAIHFLGYRVIQNRNNEDDLMENDVKSFFRAFSSLGNWILI